MPEVELSAGTVEYEDTGGGAGDGPPSRAGDGRPPWRKVIAELPEHRCLTPVLPMGAHRVPMRADADLSLRGMAHPRRVPRGPRPAGRRRSASTTGAAPR